MALLRFSLFFVVAHFVQFHIMTCNTAVSPHDVTPAQLTTRIIHLSQTAK